MESTSGSKSVHTERPISTWNGFVVMAIGLALIAVAIWQLVQGVTLGRPVTIGGLGSTLGVFLLLFLIGVLFLAGLYTLQPNEAAILQLFGSYRGSTRMPGSSATDPFYTRRKISLRARNAARTKIVHGAVSMVQMALVELSEKQVVDLDDERKAAMVSNLMTVLCAESEVQPVINTGTLYS